MSNGVAFTNPPQETFRQQTKLLTTARGKIWFMRSSEEITQRQELFAQHFALSGNGTQAALKAGCRAPNSAGVRAHHWLRNPKVEERIAELRELGFIKLRDQISNKLYASVMQGLEGGSYRTADRAMRMLNRLEIFQDADKLKDYIEGLEQRCGRSIEDILNAATEVADRLDWEEHKALHQEQSSVANRPEEEARIG